MKKYLYAGLIIGISLPLDIVSKYLIVKNFGYGDRVDFLGGFLRITLVYNEGGVFGIMQGYKSLFLVMSIIVLALMIAYYIFEKNKTTLFTAAMAMIVSGAVGNIIDRLIPGRPGVVDFIYVGVDGIFRWPAFNVADSVIVVGAFILVAVFYMEEKKRRQEESQ
jgi:signal peptidase II